MRTKSSAPKKDHVLLPFLLACTDPSVGPVDEVILTREPKHDSNKPVTVNFSHTTVPFSDTIDPSLLFLSFVGPAFSMDLDYNTLDGQPLLDTLNGPESSASDHELQARVGLLEGHFQKIATSDGRYEKWLGTYSWSSFFTATNFRHCIEVFFGSEQLLATIVHKPTFLPNQIDPTLLLTIVVSGYTYLQWRRQSQDSVSSALALREMAEKYIFDSVDQLLATDIHSIDTRRTLQVCQAAYIIATLQSCVKAAQGRQRVISQCHPSLVNLLRSCNMVGMRHEADQDWRTFVYRESCIRLVHWVFINDAWFALFSHHPPAMTLWEMSGYFPCDDEPWNAECHNSFDNLILHQKLGPSPLCLKSLMSGLLADEWTERMTTAFQQLNIKHFLVLILAFQHVIFHHQTSVFVDSGASTILRGLDRWNRLWEDALSRISDDQRKVLGLVKYCPELAFLFRRIVEVSGAEEANQPMYLQRHITYDTVTLYQFIQQIVEADARQRTF